LLLSLLAIGGTSLLFTLLSWLERFTVCLFLLEGAETWDFGV
jgi:hypothetical protein